MPHLVFVDCNVSGISAMATAQGLGYDVSFIRSSGHARLYQHHPQLPSVLDNCRKVLTVDNTASVASLVAAFREIDGLLRIDGAIATLDVVVGPLAEAAEAVGIRFTDARAVRYARDKSKCRALLERLGLSQPRYAVVQSAEELRQACDRVGFPAVMKPPSGTGSMFVRVVHDRDELREAYAAYRRDVGELCPEDRQSFDERVLLEQYVEGPLFSVEALAQDGDYQVIGTLLRRRAAEDEAIELGSFAPAPFDATTQAKVESQAKEILGVLGLDLGVFHIEFILGDQGPVLVDVNPRLIGGVGPALIGATWDVKVYELLVKLHAGLPVQRLPEQPSASSVSFLMALASPARMPEEFDLSFLESWEHKIRHLAVTATPGKVAPRTRDVWTYFGNLVVSDEDFEAACETVESIVGAFEDEYDLRFMRPSSSESHQRLIQGVSPPRGQPKHVPRDRV
jgi:biotin carboxylase